jgi:hypothetical protein
MLTDEQMRMPDHWPASIWLSGVLDSLRLRLLLLREWMVGLVSLLRHKGDIPWMTYREGWSEFIAWAPCLSVRVKRWLCDYQRLGGYRLYSTGGKGYLMFTEDKETQWAIMMGIAGSITDTV